MLGIRRYHKGRENTLDIPELSRPESWPQLPVSVLKKRCYTIRKVDECVKQNYGAKYSVHPLGSSCYGADTKDSDVDLILHDPDRPCGYELPKHQSSRTPRLYNISVLAKALTQSGFDVLLRLSQATVPIVKFRDPDTGLKCDINVNERLGYRNTLMIRQYCTILPILPAFIVQLKLWAKEQKWITNMNNYTLAIMAIGVLQHYGALPNLQKGVEQRPMTENGYFWTKSKRGKLQWCDTRWNDSEEGWEPTRRVTPDECLTMWFRYWGHEHDYNGTGIDIKRGGLFQRQRPYEPEPVEVVPVDQDMKTTGRSKWVTIPSETNIYEEPPAWANHPFCIQDPFVRDKNLASQMFKPQMKVFQPSCQKAFERLELARAQTPGSVASDPKLLAKYMTTMLLAP
ncbi:hypothetical protein PHLGIDRAFT_114709 [Phlebiopsis gigantea 11061_1 CR5-6]|uniref:Poly(A) RNA polymerase mitochondrial-like central palm domain-containing protein n=1 Tax=Phlebiopsis gigantea (strain 11061_1 CR5-6) TaxID=745531 RepID=A0A0C3S5L4_PHLG1|nr:hypothetical protein PHLGIDRAFT_114709 [Phlebiopsis gigantea 11061_1 CR5-6]